MNNENEQYNIFFSWQSDLKKNRNIISGEINSAISKLKDIGNFKLIDDSRGEDGAANLSVEIFKKIDTSCIFIGDVTIINKGKNKRLTPNPNVLIETGYAKKSLNEKHMILLYNKDESEAEKLPFDIRSNRLCGFTYNNHSNIREAIVSTIKNLYQSNLLIKYDNEQKRKPIFDIKLEIAKPEENDEIKFFENSKFAIVDNKKIELKINKCIFFEYENRYKKINHIDIPENLKINLEDIEQYNNKLPDDVTIKKYIDEYNNFQRISCNGIPFNIIINNVGNLPANNFNLKIDVSNTDIFNICETDKAQFLEEPERPLFPENPIEKAMAEKYNKSLFSNTINSYLNKQLLQVSNSFNDGMFASVNMILPNKSLKSLKLFRQSNNEISIKENVGVYKCNGISHKEGIIIKGITFVPVRVGQYELNFQLKCDEYLDFENHKFIIDVKYED